MLTGKRTWFSFSGNVVATQGERVIKSDTLELYFKKKAEGNASAAGDAAKAGDVDRIVAKGNVRITEKERIVTGEQACSRTTSSGSS